ncbi:MAG: flagellin lysine-N-methylase [Agathobacter sp.]|nr:flagellin lysine-N-methylase [Agathobacter sp.]
MILRIPDYYDDFCCIADRCKGSCCAGWEIDIDEPAREYYMGVPGEIGDRMREKLYQGEDGGFRFRLSKEGRCPFLNSKNLCDIITALGKEALSEVCTDFPRFSLTYGHVMQSVLSISCEEVGQILFSRREPVTFVERTTDCGLELSGDNEEDEGYIAFLERIQRSAIVLLQDRKRALSERVSAFLLLCTEAQERINCENWESEGQGLQDISLSAWDEEQALEWRTGADTDAGRCYEAFDLRFGMLEELEELGEKWVTAKKNVRRVLTEESYARVRAEYLASDDYDEVVYEQLLVYFAFRYLMQAVYSYDLLSYGRMAVSFALMIRDLDVCRWCENQGHLTLSDRIGNAHIFSREVEHSEENFEQIREELLFV